MQPSPVRADCVSEPTVALSWDKTPTSSCGLEGVGQLCATVQPVQKWHEWIWPSITAIIVLLSSTWNKRQNRQLLSNSWGTLGFRLKYTVASLSLDNKTHWTRLAEKCSAWSLVCEKITDLNMTGHILQAGGHRVVFSAAAAEKVTKGEGSKENRLKLARRDDRRVWERRTRNCDGPVRNWSTLEGRCSTRAG